MREDGEYAAASLLDRLIDEAPESHRDPVGSRPAARRQAEAAVRRDLEKLLNTRSYPPPSYRFRQELANSLHAYGLPDFTSRNPRSAGVRNQLRQEIEQAIVRFEPRLKNVAVLSEAPTPEERSVKFRITALLTVHTEGQPIVFDTYFDSNKGEYTIAQ